MKKVLLVTLQGDNIGNRLQNYALQKTLQKLDCEVHTPIYDLIELSTYKLKLKFIIKCLLGKLKIQKFKPYLYRYKRVKKYKDFNNKYISNMFHTNFYSIFNSKNDYDYAVTGSDQVWHNWSNNSQELKYFYLEFIPTDKRIAYAPSFGFDDFSKEDIFLHKTGLEDILYLSCREKKGIQLISDLTNRQANLVLDPTLLLDKDEWIEIEKKPQWIEKQKEYVLVYFLGDKSLYMESIIKFSRENNIKIIDIYDKNSLNSQLITPDEFIWLIHNAKYVFTDSFHATVFSLIFDIQFLSFRRKEKGMENMFDRIENVQEIFGVKNRVYINDINLIKDSLNKTSIENMKSKSIDFLMEALNKDEKNT